MTGEEERDEAQDEEQWSTEGGLDETGESTSEDQVPEEITAIKVRHEPTDRRAPAVRTLVPGGRHRRPLIKKSSIGHVQLLLDEISGTFLTEEFD